MGISMGIFGAFVISGADRMFYKSEVDDSRALEKEAAMMETDSEGEE